MNENEGTNIFMDSPREALVDDFFKNRKIVVSLVIGLLLIFLYTFFWSVPRTFPAGSIYDLKSGQTMSIVSDNFLKLNIIRSEFWFKSFVYIFSFGKSSVIEGEYALNKRENVITLAWRVSHGELNIVPTKITIPEGLNSYEIADIFVKNFPSFDRKIFLDLVQKWGFEGYLFPDTYFIMPGTSEFQIVKFMNDNFNEKLKEISTDIRKFGKNESDIIKMASIIEEEARTIETREIIAGILWKRISIKMPLQVDSSFRYINGKTTATLTTDDLKIDSPYNSYTNRGLPPTPISNPGLEAIKDVINPIKTPYLYFLSDKDGNMHYSTTFDEHVANKLKYIKTFPLING